MVDTLHELLNFYILFFVVLFETFEGAHPPLFDELVIASKLPGHFLSGFLRSEIVIWVHRAVANVFLLHHVF